MQLLQFYTFIATLLAAIGQAAASSVNCKGSSQCLGGGGCAMPGQQGISCLQGFRQLLQARMNTTDGLKTNYKNGEHILCYRSQIFNREYCLFTQGTGSLQTSIQQVHDGVQQMIAHKCKTCGSFFFDPVGQVTANYVYGSIA